jgi:hypothetical protein
MWQSHLMILSTTLPPCLKDNPNFPGIKLTHETLGESLKTPLMPLAISVGYG